MSLSTKVAIARMAAQKFPPDDNPTSSTAPTAALAIHADQPLRLLSATTRDAPRTRVRVLAAAGIAVAVVVVIGAGTVIAHSSGKRLVPTATTLTYTPAPVTDTVRTEMVDLAARAAAQPPPPGTGRFQYVHTQGWYLHTEQTTDGVILASAIVPEDRQLWRAANGEGRILADGSPATGDYAAGQLSSGFAGTPGATTGVLIAELRGQDPERDGPGWLRTTQELWNQQAVTPELQSALLTIMAGRTDLIVSGTTTDRAGRDGIAISAVDDNASPRSRYTAIFSPTTGALLSYEDVVLDTSELPVQAPATIGYTLWLGSGYTPTTKHQP